MNKIVKAIKDIAELNQELYLKVCTVDEVHEDSRTVDCSPIDEGAPILGVNLQGNQELDHGFVLLPAKGSEVIVGFLTPAVAAVLLTTEIDKAIVTIGESEVELVDGKLSITVGDSTLEIDKSTHTFNGGSETMAKANELKTQLTKMSARIDGIINAISSSPVAPMDGGATYKAAMAGALAALQKEDFSNMIDDKIKH